MWNRSFLLFLETLWMLCCSRIKKEIRKLLGIQTCPEYVWHTCTSLTFPGWCWCCWSCRHRLPLWLTSRSRVHSVELHHPVNKIQVYIFRTVYISSFYNSSFAVAILHRAAFTLTFCLLSSQLTWRTKMPSLRELTEMPKGEGQYLW